MFVAFDQEIDANEVLKTTKLFVEKVGKKVYAPPKLLTSKDYPV